jgi:hypothetical protein
MDRRGAKLDSVIMAAMAAVVVLVGDLNFLL